MSGAGLAFSTSSPVTTGSDLGRCKPFTSFGLSALPTGGDGPRQANLAKVLQELASAGQDSDGWYSAGEIFRVEFFKALDGGGICGVTYFSQKAGQEKGTAHAYAAVDFPVRDVQAEVGEGFVPGENVLIGAVDQSAIKIEKHGRERDSLTLRTIVRVRRFFHRG